MVRMSSSDASSLGLSSVRPDKGGPIVIAYVSADGRSLLSARFYSGLMASEFRIRLAQQGRTAFLSPEESSLEYTCG
jgi:hypothetical protein